MNLIKVLEKLENISRKLDLLDKSLDQQKFMVPQHMSLSEWNEYKKKHKINGPADYHKKFPNAKWKIVHGNKKGEIGKPLKGMTNMSYAEAVKAHAAVYINKHS